MRRLNVRSAQIDECIQQSLFAISFRPQNPELYAGEPLLLQLVKDEARKQGKEHARINFALIFDHLERDHDGSISRAHWPKEQLSWPYSSKPDNSPQGVTLDTISGQPLPHMLNPTDSGFHSTWHY